MPRITAQQRHEIIRLRRHGITRKEIARRVGVGAGSVSRTLAKGSDRPVMLASSHASPSPPTGEPPLLRVERLLDAAGRELVERCAVRPEDDEIVDLALGAFERDVRDYREARAKRGGAAS